MMSRIREAESDQMIGELKQKIAAIEIQKEEVLAADRLESKGGTQDLANTIFDLQEEVGNGFYFNLTQHHHFPHKPDGNIMIYVNQR